MDYPVSIANVPKEDWVDFDEASVFVETATGKSGKRYIGVRAREEGPYNHSERHTLTMALYGGCGDFWLDFEQKAGTAINNTYDFVLQIPRSTGRGTPQRRRLFTVDNLLTHKSRVVVGLNLEGGALILFPRTLISGR